MKTLTFFTLLFFSINLNAQIFAPKEAVWYYTYDPDVTLDDGYQKIEVVGDSTVNNRVCKVLQKTNIGYNYMDKEYYEIDAGKSYIYEEDSIVYYSKGNQFYILYDFSAKQGETYNSICFQEYCNQEFSVTIDSITNITNEGKILKKFHCTLKDTIDTFHTYFIEKIGYPNYLLPSFELGCVMVVGAHYPDPLRCYSDSEIGLFSTGVVSSCDYVTSSKENQLKNEIVRIFPNPAKNQESIQIELFDKKVKNISVYNLLGAKIKDYWINNETKMTITISKPSVYIICLFDENNRVISRQKIIIK